MPAYSTLRTFIDSLRTGETNITHSLESLLNNPEKRRARAGDVQNLDVSQPFPEWLREEFRNAGMSEKEINHIESWPNTGKEIVRSELQAAIGTNGTLRFNWEIFDGDHPETAVRSRDGANARIVFQSPRTGVQLHHFNFGAIHVDA
jgi:hypothetical protein